VCVNFFAARQDAANQAPTEVLGAFTELEALGKVAQRLLDVLPGRLDLVEGLQGDLTRFPAAPNEEQGLGARD
jgi:hypothetical protein